MRWTLLLLAVLVLPRAIAADDDEGRARVVVRVFLNGLPAPSGTRVFFYPPGRDDEYLASGWPDEPTRLAPGHYDVQAEIPSRAGIVVLRSAVEVEAGRNEPIELHARQRTGLLRVKVASKGGPLPGTRAFLLPERSRGTQGQSIPLDGEAEVATGRYSVGLEVNTLCGPIFGYRDDVEVKEGEALELEIEPLPAGSVTITFDGPVPNQLHLARFIRVAGGQECQPMEVGDTQPLPPGLYEVVVEPPRGPGRTWRVRVSVAEGEHQVVTIGSGEGEAAP